MVENVGGELEIPVFNFACKTLCGPWEFTEIQLENFGLEHNTEVRKQENYPVGDLRVPNDKLHYSNEKNRWPQNKTVTAHNYNNYSTQWISRISREQGI